MSRETDIASVEAVVDRAYAVISGPVGAARDWDGMRVLYLPEARMTALRPAGTESCTIEEYIASKGAFLVDNGFAESALVNRIEVYGDIAHAWSSYSGDWTETDGTPGKTVGINSFQLRRVGGRWLIHSLLWQVETPDHPLPRDMGGAG